MTFFEEIQRRQRLHKFIIQESTGTPNELAQRFHLSRRQLYNLLDEFKVIGAEIGYSRIRETFYYKNNFNMELSIKISLIDSDEEKNIDAGEKNSCCAILFHGSCLSLQK